MARLNKREKANNKKMVSTNKKSKKVYLRMRYY